MRYELEMETFDKMWLRDHGFVDEAGMPSKESMTKLAEEAMESYSAWEDMRAARADGGVTVDQWLRLTHKLLDELADVIQAAGPPVPYDLGEDAAWAAWDHRVEPDPTLF